MLFYLYTFKEANDPKSLEQALRLYHYIFKDPNKGNVGDYV